MAALTSTASATPGAGARPTGGVNVGHVILFAAMVTGQFMAILDIQIVSASLTKVQAGLGASADEVSWIQTSYLIAEVIMIPFSGFMSRWLSTRVVFVGATAGFTVASMAAGLAHSMTELILARAGQGIFAGLMVPIVFATSFTIFPPGIRDKTMVLMGLIVPLAPTVGPTLGGWITEVSSWRWLFFINLVPGLMVMAVVWRLGKIDRGDPSLSKGFDFIGLVGMAMFLGGVEYVLEEGPRRDWLDDPWVLRASIVLVLGAAVFFWRTFTYTNPVVDLRAFQHRNFAVGSGLQLLLGVGLFGATFLVPLYLAQVRNLDAVQIGIVMCIGGIFMFPTAPVSSYLISRIDARLQIGLGALIAGVGFYTATGVTKDWDFWEFALPQAARSVGLMLIFPAITRLSLGTLPLELVKGASGIFNLMRQLGGAIGLALLASLLADRRQFHWQRLAESVNLSRPEVQSYYERLTERAGAMAGIDPDAFAARRLGGTVLREASVMAFSDAFFALSLSFLLIAALLTVVSKPQIAAPAPVAPTTPAAKGAR